MASANRKATFSKTSTVEVEGHSPSNVFTKKDTSSRIIAGIDMTKRSKENTSDRLRRMLDHSHNDVPSPSGNNESQTTRPTGQHLAVGDAFGTGTFFASWGGGSGVSAAPGKDVSRELHDASNVLPSRVSSRRTSVMPPLPPFQDGVAPRSLSDATTLLLSKSFPRDVSRHVQSLIADVNNLTAELEAARVDAGEASAELLAAEQDVDAVTADLQARVDALLSSRRNNDSAMAPVRSIAEKIDQSTAKMKAIAETQAETERTNLVRAFARQIQVAEEALSVDRQGGMTSSAEPAASRRPAIYRQTETLRNALRSLSQRCASEAELLKQNTAQQTMTEAEHDSLVFEERSLLGRIAAYQKANNLLSGAIGQLDALDSMPHVDPRHVTAGRQEAARLVGIAKELPGRLLDTIVSKDGSDAAGDVEAEIAAVLASVDAEASAAPPPLASKVSLPPLSPSDVSAAAGTRPATMTAARSAGLDSSNAGPTFEAQAAGVRRVEAMEAALAEYNRVNPSDERVLLQSEEALKEHIEAEPPFRALLLQALRDYIGAQKPTRGPTVPAGGHSAVSTMRTVTEQHRADFMNRFLVDGHVLRQLYASDPRAETAAEPSAASADAPAVDMNLLWHRWKDWTTSSARNELLF